MRLYTRETTTWRLLCWQAQALSPQMLRLIDRAGVFDLAGIKPVDAVCAALQKWPCDVIESGLSDLLARGVLEHHDDCLVWPKFLEAQEASQSDRQRQAESRARRREFARASSRNVTICSSEVQEGARDDVGATRRKESTSSRSGTDRHDLRPNRHEAQSNRSPRQDSQTRQTHGSVASRRAENGHDPVKAAFEEFWAAKPAREGNSRAKAFASFVRAVEGYEEQIRGRKISHPPTATEVIIAGAHRWHEMTEKRGNAGTQFVPMASTWLNQRRWEDANEAATSEKPRVYA